MQSTYNENQDAGRVGQIVDCDNKKLISRTAEEVIEFGMPVAQGANDKGCINAASGDVIVGIATRERSTLNGNFGLHDSVRVMSGEGCIWVEAAVAVAAGDPVHFDGGWTNTGGSAIPNSRYDTSAAAGDLVQVRLG